MGNPLPHSFGFLLCVADGASSVEHARRCCAVLFHRLTIVALAAHRIRFASGTRLAREELDEYASSSTDGILVESYGDECGERGC